MLCLPHLAASSPPHTTFLPLRPFRAPFAGGHSITTRKSTVPSRSLSSESDAFSSSSSSSSSSPCSPLSTLTSYGIPMEQATSILTKFPFLRNCNPTKTLKPKLDFLLNAGFTGADMAVVLTANPQLLSKSLERSIAPSIHFLKTILPSKDALLRVLKSTNMLLTPEKEAYIKVLKLHGVPDDKIARLLREQPRALARNEEDFVAAVERVKELGLEPTTSKFVAAVGVLSYMSRSSFQRKVDLYRELGWSEESVYAMFKRKPHCMALSDEKIKAKMGYFTQKLGWGPESVALNPVVLGLSIDGTIVPRCAVLNFLMMKSLLRKITPRPWRFMMSERKFYESYVMMYEKNFPEVTKAYQGKIEFQGWEWLKDEKMSSSSRKS